MKAALLIGHGSRSNRSNDEVRRIAEELKRKSGMAVFQHAFLEMADPDVSKAIDSCVSRGAKEIIVLLHFLNSGDHVLRDVPFLINKAKRRFPRVRFRVLPIVGSHPKVADLYMDWIRSDGGHARHSGAGEPKGKKGGFRHRRRRRRGRRHPQSSGRPPERPSSAAE